jgi:hypothetical protein
VKKSNQNSETILELLRDVVTAFEDTNKTNSSHLASGIAGALLAADVYDKESIAFKHLLDGLKRKVQAEAASGRIRPHTLAQSIYFWLEGRESYLKK